TAGLARALSLPSRQVLPLVLGSVIGPGLQVIGPTRTDAHALDHHLGEGVVTGSVRALAVGSVRGVSLLALEKIDVFGLSLIPGGVGNRQEQGLIGIACRAATEPDGHVAGFVIDQADLALGMAKLVKIDAELVGAEAHDSFGLELGRQ